MRFAIAASLFCSSIALAESPPAPLACVARYYAVTPEKRGADWFAILPDGAAIPYDDHRTKTVEQRVDAPDVKDLFFYRYPTGAIRPVTKPDEDPGRIRHDAMMRATYPLASLSTIQFLDHTVTVHQKVAEAFQRVSSRLEKAIAADPTLKIFFKKLGGTFAQRPVGASHKASAHAFGISIDLNEGLANYWRWQRPPVWGNRIPQAIVDAFEAEGFIWGGRWYRFDTIHFEYRPELLDAKCYP